MEEEAEEEEEVKEDEEEILIPASCTVPSSPTRMFPAFKSLQGAD